MAWTKIPPENHPLFRAALPRHPGLTVVAMFGGLCALVNGNMAAGLFAHSVFVTLDEDGVREVLALDGGAPFDPMGNGRAFPGRVMLPESILDEPDGDDDLRSWLRRAVEHTATLPPKKPKGPKKTKTNRTAKTAKATSTRAPARARAGGRARAARSTRKARPRARK